jgi:hypothetical protein
LAKSFEDIPRNRGCIGHQRNMESSGISAKMQGTARDKGRKLDNVQIPRKYPGRFSLKKFQQTLQFVFLPLIGGTGNDKFKIKRIDSIPNRFILLFLLHLRPYNFFKYHIAKNISNL